MFNQSPPIYWPNFGSTATAIALTIGFLAYVIGYFSGGRLNTTKMWVAIILATLISLFARTITFKLQLLIASVLPEEAASILVEVIWTFFIVGIAVNLYETLVVTAREAHPMR